MGIVIHSTASKGGTADDNASYFNRVQVNANAHYFVDWNKAVATVPEMKWHGMLVHQQTIDILEWKCVNL